MNVSRQQRRALSQKAAKKFVRERRSHLGRQERKELTKELTKRAYNETPAHMFAKHIMERPRIIVPQVEIQAEGLPQTSSGERVTPGGIILLD